MTSAMMLLNAHATGILANVVLLFVLGMAVVSAAGPSNFRDYLAVASQTESGSNSVTPSYHYEPSEVQETCLHEVAYLNCRDNTPLYYYESHVSCCGNKGPYELLTEVPGVGHCDFTEYDFTDATPTSNPQITKLGTFTAICTLSKGSEECGHPLCDKMTLNVQGDVFEVANAILTSAPSTYPGLMDDACGGNSTNRLLAPHMQAKGRAAGTDMSGSPTRAKAAYVVEDGEFYERNGAPRTLYKVPQAYVYHGAMTIHGRYGPEHGAKFHDGFFEYIFGFTHKGSVQISEADAAGAYVMDPYTYKLTFLKENAY